MKDAPSQFVLGFVVHFFSMPQLLPVQYTANGLVQSSTLNRDPEYIMLPVKVSFDRQYHAPRGAGAGGVGAQG